MTEFQLPVLSAEHLVVVLVHRPVMPATERGQVRERRRSALRPMPNVMALDESAPTAREATAPIAMLQCPPQRRWNRPRPGPDLHEGPVGIVPHHHSARVARQPL